MAKYVTLGSKASIFHDQSTGITVTKGEVKELNIKQFNSPRIKKALAGGHLVYAQAPAKVENKVQEPVEDEINNELAHKLYENFKKDVEAGKDVNKLKKAYKVNQLKAIADVADIEVEEGDTAKDLIEAIMEVILDEEKNNN